MDKKLTANQKTILLMNISAHLGAMGKFNIGNASAVLAEIELHTNDIDDLFKDQMLMDEIIAFNILDTALGAI